MEMMLMAAAQERAAEARESGDVEFAMVAGKADGSGAWVTVSIPRDAFGSTTYGQFAEQSRPLEGESLDAFRERVSQLRSPAEDCERVLRHFIEPALMALRERLVRRA